MQLNDFAETTQLSYTQHVQRFAKHFKQSPEHLGQEEIKVYLHKLVKETKSKSYINQAYSAIRFLYETTMKQDWESFKIPRSKKEKRLPIALNKNEIVVLLNAIPNLKHKAIFELMYCGGLRVSEVTKLKLTDINSKDMSIFVDYSKGKKNRYTILSKRVLQIFRDYYKIYRPNGTYLFAGQNPNMPLSTRTIQHIFKKIKAQYHLNPKATTHSIRHSFATHMLEAGVDIYHLQKLMGHSCVKTTSIYIHISTINAIEIINPLDVLDPEDSDHDTW